MFNKKEPTIKLIKGGSTVLLCYPSITPETKPYSYIFVTLHSKDNTPQVKYGNNKQRVKLGRKLVNGYANRKYLSPWALLYPIADCPEKSAYRLGL